jgi:pimeloyl-ACP methyl ester carboxylesterase
MCALADMQPFDPKPHIFEGAGHNVHVERPDELWKFIRNTIA